MTRVDSDVGTGFVFLGNCGTLPPLAAGRVPLMSLIPPLSAANGSSLPFFGSPNFSGCKSTLGGCSIAEKREFSLLVGCKAENCCTLPVLANDALPVLANGAFPVLANDADQSLLNGIDACDCVGVVLNKSPTSEEKGCELDCLVSGTAGAKASLLSKTPKLFEVFSADDVMLGGGEKSSAVEKKGSGFSCSLPELNAAALPFGKSLADEDCPKNGSSENTF